MRFGDLFKTIYFYIKSNYMISISKLMLNNLIQHKSGALAIVTEMNECDIIKISDQELHD